MSGEAVAGAATEVAKTVVEKAEIVLDSIPDRPKPLAEIATELVGEPTLQSMGLASWWPSGRVQWFMEYLHINVDMPWWGTIMVSTLVMRIILFPVLLYAQRNSAKMAQHGPEMQKLQAKMSEARRRGDLYESQVLGQELTSFYKNKGVNPLKSASPLFAQVPL